MCDRWHWLRPHPACYKGAPHEGEDRSKGGGQMGFPVRTCALVGRFADPRIAESVGALLPHLKGRGVQVLVSEDAELPAGGAAR